MAKLENKLKRKFITLLVASEVIFAISILFTDINNFVITICPIFFLTILYSYRQFKNITHSEMVSRFNKRLNIDNFKGYIDNKFEDRDYYFLAFEYYFFMGDFTSAESILKSILASQKRKMALRILALEKQYMLNIFGQHYDLNLRNTKQSEMEKLLPDKSLGQLLAI